ncbi:GDSL-type esterase/lipase family protein [Paenibacillus sp. WQ 127069]|uniref:GDSL-type esterase/lipase family protein n=2 Tax=Paenibacillus baimaensis TaxID=2982185 RepID=A0ABT2UBX2_9BACL|nr:GDSL-type esterase/lipase family protein [Paenibacillus sp. WQ 127069]
MARKRTVGAAFKFDFGLGAAENSYVKIGAETSYDVSLGYGFADVNKVYAIDREEAGGLRRDFCIPLNTAFIVDVPDGNYHVTLMVGDTLTATETTVKSGEGRLLLHRLQTAAGQFIKRSFAVHVSGGQLILAFSGIAPRLNALEITASSQIVTVFLAGDSTVTDQEAEGYPYAGWGQMLPHCLNASAAVANHAKSGRSSKSFIDEGRLEAILQLIRPNDYLLIQFGHNDQKPDLERRTEPATTYKHFLKLYIDGARERGALPVLITAVHRRIFDENGLIINTHGEYLQAVKELGEAEEVPVIDLADKTRKLYEAYGAERSKRLFLWSVPGEFPNHPSGAADNTHFQERGAIEVAKLAAEGIRQAQLNPLMLFLN